MLIIVINVKYCCQSTVMFINVNKNPIKKSPLFQRIKEIFCWEG